MCLLYIKKGTLSCSSSSKFSFFSLTLVKRDFSVKKNIGTKRMEERRGGDMQACVKEHARWRIHTKKNKKTKKIGTFTYFVFGRNLSTGFLLWETIHKAFSHVCLRMHIYGTFTYCVHMHIHLYVFVLGLCMNVVQCVRLNVYMCF